MAGEDLDLGDDGGANDTAGAKGKKHKPLSKGQKIGVAIGAITILLVIVQIERSKSASAATTTATTSSTPIDPQTGYPSGSAADQAALAQMASAADQGSYGSGYYGSDGTGGSSSSLDTGTDPSTGASYSSEIAANSGALSTLGTDFQTLENQFSSLQGEVVPPATSTETTTPLAPTVAPSSSVGLTPAQQTKLSSLNAQLAKDEASKTKGAKANVPVLKKQITAVESR